MVFVDAIKDDENKIRRLSFEGRVGESSEPQPVAAGSGDQE